MADNVQNWIAGWSGETVTGWNPVDPFVFSYQANNSQAYYTTPTSSVEDAYGNVTNYYRGGDTTTTKIIDSYNQTFNTINNTTNNTTNYSANVKLSDFLNTYTTVNNDYTYNTSFKSWYYDQSTNNYTYDASQTYYNTDNSRYYISIDNSTDEYYLINVQYSPTCVTVNYTYNNIDNSTHYGDVTNVYYFELKDGRNSSTLSASEVAGLDLGYDVTNYELVIDDPNTLSLQHFDGDYTDSSPYGRDFYSVNRSTNYVDSGDFGKALQLPSGSSAGVTIPGLSDYDSLCFDFRIYYSDISKLGIYLGDTNLFQRLPAYKYASFYDYYTDDGITYNLGRFCYNCIAPHPYPYYWDVPIDQNKQIDPTLYGYTWSTALKSSHSVPTAASVSSWSTVNSSLYGWFGGNWNTPVVTGSGLNQYGSEPAFIASTYLTETINSSTHRSYEYTTKLSHSKYTSYRSYPSSSVAADFPYSTYVNQWVSMRITISGGNLYYFVNGDLVGSGAFTMPDADKFYISSVGTIYLDELRVTTGDMVSTSVYTPSGAPYDTNKVLALPDDLTASTIYVQHSTPVTSSRIGGVRPSNPTTGFLYIPLYDDYTGGQPQLYDGSNWVNVTALVYNGTTTVNALGYSFSPVSASPDVNMDLEPGRPTDPDEDADPDTGSDDGEESGGFLSWLGSKLGELFGAIGGGILSLLQSALGKIFDGLINLVNMVFEKLSQIVDLFGSFGDALGVLWTWLPAEIVTVFVAAVTVFVFVALLKLFMK